MDNEISTKALEQKEETILLKGNFHNKVFIVGIVLAIFSIGFSIYCLATQQDSFLPSGIDYMIITVSTIFLFVSIKELKLNRKRMISLTNKRVYGNTGIDSFDLLYSDIVDIEQKVKKSFISGNLQYVYIKTNTNTEINIEQLKNIEEVIQLIKAKR